MIAYLQWKVLELDSMKCLLLTGAWIWYEVWINEQTFSVLSEWADVSMYIYHHRTENSQNLFGFIQREEKSVFEELIKINGVWGKVALNILSIGINKLLNAISSGDNATIESIKWIGKKWAGKIILELKDKDFIKQYKNLNTSEQTTWDNTSELDSSDISTDLRANVTTTLVTMWYNISNIEKTLANLPESHTTLEEILPYVIKNI